MHCWGAKSGWQLGDGKIDTTRARLFSRRERRSRGQYIPGREWYVCADFIYIYLFIYLQTRFSISLSFLRYVNPSRRRKQTSREFRFLLHRLPYQREIVKNVFCVPFIFLSE